MAIEKELIVAKRPKSSVSESLKIIRTNLQFSSVDQKIKSILVTSSFPGEGKSFIAANLAVAYAQVGTKVLLVDCDLRRGRQHKIFGYENEHGLSNLLIDDIKNKHEEYIQKTEIKNLSVLTSGTVPPNPSKLISSSRNARLMGLLNEKYDLVIYDGVPTIGLADTLILADLVDKIVIVSAYKKTPIEKLENTKKILENFKEKIAGVVFNQVPGNENSYYDDYYSA